MDLPSDDDCCSAHGGEASDSEDLFPVAVPTIAQTAAVSTQQGPDVDHSGIKWPPLWDKDVGCVLCLLMLGKEYYISHGFRPVWEFIGIDTSLASSFSSVETSAFMLTRILHSCLVKAQCPVGILTGLASGNVQDVQLHSRPLLGIVTSHVLNHDVTGVRRRVETKRVVHQVLMNDVNSGVVKPAVLASMLL